MIISSASIRSGFFINIADAKIVLIFAFCSSGCFVSFDDSLTPVSKTPFDGAYRLRVGDYRVILYLEEELMLISKIAHRKEMY